MTQNGVSRDELARQANEVRSDLLRTVAQLGRRRRAAMQALDPSVQMVRHARAFATLGGLLILGAAAGAAWVAHRAVTAPLRRRRARWLLVRTVWRRPEQLLPAEPSLLGRTLGRVASALVMSLGATVLDYVARRARLILSEPTPPAAATAPAAPAAPTG